ncbi:hypothetical protein DYB26_015927 [Aphanomyces astaci]|uniref:Uncharacterized protein n=1 Tax=Aphanomyces astaci TaxID=112090 RepID=A0A3R7AU63_APHAT|nr:hypothetical protein DYB26_015927 [Aphanomyces astaci]
MKTAVVLSILAVAAANKHKISPSVLELLEQSSPVNVFVLLSPLGDVHKPSGVMQYPNCESSLIGVFTCEDLTEKEVLSIAALPEVERIIPFTGSSAPDTPNVTPKATTTPKPVTTPKPAVITPKPVVSDDNAVDNQHKIGPGVLQSLQQSTTVTVSVAFHDDSRGSVVDKYHKCLKHPPLAGLILCNDLSLDEVNRFAALPEVKEILATRDNSVPDTPNVTPKPTTTAATPTNSACNEQRDSSDDRD